MRFRLRIGLLGVIAAACVALFVTTGSAMAAGSIEGEVSDSVSKTGVKEVQVCAFDEAELEPPSCNETDSSGEYALNGLPSGGYIVRFWAPYLGYVTQYFDSAIALEDADEVVVATGPVTGVDAEMEEGGEISGQVTDAAAGAGIQEVEVCAFNSSVFAGCTETGVGGNYTLQGVASGSYVVEFWAEFLGYETRFYNESTSTAGASLVSVSAPGTTGGINARLSKPGSNVITPAVPSVVLPVLPIRKVVNRPKRKALTCRKGFKKIKRHGRKVCIKKHRKKKHRS